jgi:DNA-binding MarR family transcriptional regulator
MMKRNNHLRAKRKSAVLRSERTADSTATILSQWSTQRSDLDLGPLGMFIGLAHVYWLTTPRIERLMASHGVSRGVFDVLTTLRRVGRPFTLSPSQITRSLLLSPAGLTGRLERLEQDRYVIRLPDPNDGRGLRVRLTAKGLRLVDRILPELIELERVLASGLSSRQTEQLTELLDVWVKSFRSSGEPMTDRSRAKGRPS